MREELLLFKDSAKEFGLELSDFQIEQFFLYYELLIEKNKVMNLTAITELREVIQKHFLDSISLAKIMDLSQDFSLIDLGTGAGFPGIPLKIVFPHLNLCLVDSLNKRIQFLREIVQKLNFNRIECIHARAEELARRKEYREEFDICLSRAVANLSTLSEYSLPFLKVGGRFISYKANGVEEELEYAKKAISLLGGRCEGISHFDLPDSEIHRAFVVIKKEKKTPSAYPRKAGVPSKNPLV
jgi:16S rRNA (guanine527-N7)-methyltransferase